MCNWYKPKIGNIVYLPASNILGVKLSNGMMAKCCPKYSTTAIYVAIHRPALTPARKVLL